MNLSSKIARASRNASTVGSWRLGVAAAALVVFGLAAQQEPAPQQPPGAPAAQAPAQQPSEIGLRITGEPGVAPRYAVPDFIASTPAVAQTAQMLAQVLWDDLNFEREFYMLPRDTYKTIPVARTADQVPFDAWREIGADAVFFGSVQQKGEDIVVQVRLFDVRSRAPVYSHEYTTRARNARQIAHTVSDEIHMQQRSLVGIARTRLTFVSDRNNQSVLGTVEKRNVKEIYVSDYDGANQQRITTTRQLNNNPSWSADSRAIAYSAYRNDGAPNVLVSFIYTGVLQDLTKNRFGAYLPVFSPDGKQILFAATPPGESSQDIYVMNADGSNARRLTTHPDIDTTPTWSPSGTRIAFVSRRTGRPQIYTMDANGANVQRLNIPAADAEVDRPTWSPSPYNEIAYSARTGAGFDIKVIDLTTGAVRQLTFGEGTNESPAYSPTGRHLAFTSTRRGLVHVFVMDRLGGSLRQVTTAGNNTAPDWSNLDQPR